MVGGELDGCEGSPEKRMNSVTQIMMLAKPQTAGTVLVVGLCLTVMPLAGCGENKLVLDGQMKGEMRGELQTTLKLDGPMTIQMQMQGPTVKYDGVYISEKLFDRVKVGETRADWLLAVFGEPTGKGPLENGDEIWKWAYRPLEQTTSVLSVFGGGTKDEPSLQPATAFVRLKDGAVVEKWRD